MIFIVLGLGELGSLGALGELGGLGELQEVSANSANSVCRVEKFVYCFPVNIAKLIFFFCILGNH